MNSPGRFITFEGIDGAGKSTQHARLAASLVAQGHAVVATREPGGTPLGEALRTLVLNESMDLATEALLMFAARREHVVQVIAPALARGDWVICDRFTDASLAYQGGGRGMSLDKLRQLAHWVLGDLQPDLTFWFDAPVAVAQARLAAGTANPDRFEREQAAFFSDVRAVYADIAAAEPQRVRRIDASLSPDEISALIEKTIATI